MKRFLAGAQLPGEQYGDKGIVHRQTWPVVENLRTYSQSKAWRDMVREVLEELAPAEGFQTEYRNVAGSTELGLDRSPAIRIEEVELQRSEVRLLGRSNGEHSLEYVLLDGAGEPLSRAALTLVQQNPGEHRVFHQLIECDLRTAAIVVRSSEIPTSGKLRPSCRFTLPVRWRAEIAQ